MCIAPYFAGAQDEGVPKKYLPSECISYEDTFGTTDIPEYEDAFWEQYNKQRGK